MTRRIAVALLATALSFLPLVARATQQSEAYQLADAVVTSLWTLGDVRDLMEKGSAKSAGPKADPLEVYLTTLVSMRTAILRTQEARSGLETLKESKIEMVREAATTLDATCASLGIFLKQLMNLITEEGQSADQRKTATRLGPQVAEVITNLNEAWRLLPMVSVATAHALVDGSKLDGDGTIGTLRITATERAALRKRFETIRIEKMRHQVDLALFTLRDFLMQEQWKTK